MTQPNAVYWGSGTATWGSVGPISPPFTSTQKRVGDINIVVAESDGANSPTITAGYEHVPGSPVSTGSTAADTKLSVWWKRLTSADEAAPEIDGFADHCVCRQILVRFASRDADPFVESAAAAKAGSTLLTTFPDITTEDPTTLILLFAAAPHVGDTWDDTTLDVGGVGLPSAVIFENWTNLGNDGGIWAARYTKNLPGTPGLTTIDRLISGPDVTLALAVKSLPTIGRTTKLIQPGRGPNMRNRFRKTVTQFAADPLPAQIAASAAVTEAPDAASGALHRVAPISGAAIEAADIAAGTIRSGIKASGAATESPDVAAAVLHRQTDISGAATEARDIAAGVLRLPIYASAAVTEAADVVAANVNNTFDISGAATEGSDTAAATVFVPYPPITEIVQGTSPGALIFLYELDLTSFGAGIARFTPMVSRDGPPYSEVRFGGEVYTPIPLMAKGFEKSAKGALARPRLQISNVTNLVTQLLRDYGDLKGVRLTRIRTFAQYLDAPDGISPDTGQTLPVEEYIISRKAQHNKVFVEFELRAAIDIEGVVIPKRVLLRNCMARARIWNAATETFTYDTSDMACPYDGTFYFDKMNAFTADPAQEGFSKTIDCCKIRFGERAVLPFMGFPGAARVR